jgi:hypothetical protein
MVHDSAYSAGAYLAGDRCRGLSSSGGYRATFFNYRRKIVGEAAAMDMQNMPPTTKPFSRNFLDEKIGWISLTKRNDRRWGRTPARKRTTVRARTFGFGVGESPNASIVRRPESVSFKRVSVVDVVCLAGLGWQCCAWPSTPIVEFGPYRDRSRIERTASQFATVVPLSSSESRHGVDLATR